MFTAKDFRKKVKDVELCTGMDAWLDIQLIKTFNFMTDTATIPSGVILDMGWNKAHFVFDMTIRGFIVDYHCEDRPCGSCWYTITLPPGDE